jgi:hypothetical protein
MHAKESNFVDESFSEQIYSYQRPSFQIPVICGAGLPDSLCVLPDPPGPGHTILSSIKNDLVGKLIDQIKNINDKSCSCKSNCNPNFSFN